MTCFNLFWPSTHTSTNDIEKKKVNKLKIKLFLSKSCYLFSQINMLVKICFKIKCLVFNIAAVPGEKNSFDRMKVIPYHYNLRYKK